MDVCKMRLFQSVLVEVMLMALLDLCLSLSVTHLTILSSSSFSPLSPSQPPQPPLRMSCDVEQT